MKRKKSRITARGSLLLFLTVFFLAVMMAGAENTAVAETPLEMEEADQEPLKYHVVVTATRTEQPELELGSSATLISLEEMRRAGKRTVAEALAGVPGLDVLQSGGMGTHTSVFIRGANTEHTLILVDGVEINDPVSPGRAGDISNLGLDNVERIEIVRGPQSTLYGSDAMSGVIQIFTKKGVGKPKITLSVEGGSYATFRETAGLNGGDEKMNYALELSRADATGFSSAAEQYGNTEDDGYGNTTASAKMGFRPVKNLNIQLNSRYVQSRSELDYGPGPLGDDPNYISENRQWISSLQARLTLLDGVWEQRLELSYNNINRELRDDVDSIRPLDSSTGLYRSGAIKLEWQHNLRVFKSHTLTAGFELERENGRSEYAWTGPWGNGESFFPHVTAETWGVYFQDSIKVRDTFFAAVGVRLDSHELFGSHVTFRAAPALALKSGTKIKATVGSGFKAPSLYHLYAPATHWGPVGNADLKPETSLGWDAGFEQSFLNDRLTLGVTYFHNTYTNLIEYDWYIGYKNEAKATTQGLECVLSAQLLEKITVKSSYTYTDTKDKRSGLPLLRRPAHKATLNLSRRWEKTTLGIDIAYMGKRDDLFPYPTRVTVGAYTLINATASHRLTKNLEIFARLDNITDVVYEAVTGYGSPRRSFSAGFRVN